MTVVADGAWLLPEFATSLRIDGVDVRAAYLHEVDESMIRATLDGRRAVRDPRVVAPEGRRPELGVWELAGGGGEPAGLAGHRRAVRGRRS